MFVQVSILVAILGSNSKRKTKILYKNLIECRKTFRSILPHPRTNKGTIQENFLLTLNHRMKGSVRFSLTFDIEEL